MCARHPSLTVCGCGRVLSCERRWARIRDTLFAVIRAFNDRDPPFGVPIAGFASGLGNTKHEDLVMGSNLSKEELRTFLAGLLAQLVRWSTDGSIHYVWMDWRGINALLTVAEEFYTEIKNVCLWNKSNAGMGSLYRSKHELVAVFKNGTRPHTNNIEIGRHGRNRTNVWDCPSQKQPQRLEEGKAFTSPDG